MASGTAFMRGLDVLVLASDAEPRGTSWRNPGNLMRPSTPASLTRWHLAEGRQRQLEVLTLAERGDEHGKLGRRRLRGAPDGEAGDHVENADQRSLPWRGRSRRPTMSAIICPPVTSVPRRFPVIFETPTRPR